MNRDCDRLYWIQEINFEEIYKMTCDEMTQEAEAELTQEVFEYLDELRESGITNMFGAGQYIQEEFDFERKEASAFLVKWMETFSERHPQN